MAGEINHHEAVDKEVSKHIHRQLENSQLCPKSVGFIGNIGMDL